MRPLGRLLAFVLLFALVAAGAAFAGPGDPEERITRTDQARAQAMLLREVDLPQGFVRRTSSDESDRYCKALDESDLTLTGEAVAEFVRQPTGVASTAQVYESVADANASWRRGTSAAGERCLDKIVRDDLQSAGIRDVRFDRLAFPRFAQRTIAYRATGFLQGVPVFADLVVLQQSRAQAAIVMNSALGPFAKSQQIRLARIVEGRMVKAMRG